jgi:AcrR family transcriptional regulator
VTATKGDRRRQRILDVVRELLASSSYEQISIAEITRRAEVTRPAFYFYFPSKGAAVASLMEGLYDEFMSAAAIWYDHHDQERREAFRIGMEQTVAVWRKHAPVLLGMVQAAAADPAADAIWQQWIGAFRARAVPVIAADLPRRAPVDTESLTTALVDATFAAMQRDVRALVETGAGTPHLVETLVHLWTAVVYSVR